MHPSPDSWQERFGFTLCAANAIDATIAPGALGVAVVYSTDAGSEKVFLVIESRADTLLNQCQRRLQTAKLPPLTALTVAFKAEKLAEGTKEAVSEACREQVILATQLRRELRPAMR